MLKVFMVFPAANISIKQWDPDEDIFLYMLMDEFVYFKDEKIFSEYFLNKKFADAEGKIFEITGKKEIPAWRKFFGFIPGVCRIEPVFTETNEIMQINEFREFLLSQVLNRRANDNSEWIAQIKNAKSINEMWG